MESSRSTLLKRRTAQHYGTSMNAYYSNRNGSKIITRALMSNLSSGTDLSRLAHAQVSLTIRNVAR